MTQASDVAVEISPQLTDPALLAAVDEATRYFLEEYGELPSNPEWGNARLRWVPSPHLPGSVRPIFEEEHPESDAGAHAVDIPISQLQDEYGLTANMNRLFRQVTRARMAVSSNRIDRWLLELEREEATRGD